MKLVHFCALAVLACLAAVLLAGAAPAGWNGNGGWKSPETGKSVAFQIDPAATSASVGQDKAAFTIPSWMGGWTLSGVDCRVYTPGSGTGSLDVGVSRRTGSSEAVMYSATVDTGYTKSSGSASAENCGVAAGDLVSVGVTGVHSTPSAGLWVTLTFSP